MCWIVIKKKNIFYFCIICCNIVRVKLKCSEIFFNCVMF